MRDGSLKIVVGTGFVMGFCFVLALNETRRYLKRKVHCIKNLMG